MAFADEAKHTHAIDAGQVQVEHDRVVGSRLETPEGLKKRLESISRRFASYEQSMRDLSGGNLRLVVSFARRYPTPPGQARLLLYATNPTATRGCAVGWNTLLPIRGMSPSQPHAMLTT